MINLICPGCNAPLKADESREFMFCEYCGHRIQLSNKTEYTYHEIKDAEIRKAEAGEKIGIAKTHKDRFIACAYLIGFIAILVYLFMMAYFFG